MRYCAAISNGCWPNASPIANAGVYGDDLSKCLVKSASKEDQLLYVDNAKMSELMRAAGIPDKNAPANPNK